MTKRTKDRDMSMTTQTTAYSVSGMTCGHCVAAITEEVSALGGVTGVEIDLVAGGLSRLRVSVDALVTDDAVGAAVEEAGYHLVGVAD
jgi:copper chaperone